MVGFFYWVSDNNLYIPCLGFEKPSAIQQRAIRQIIKGRDIIAQYVYLYILIVSNLLTNVSFFQSSVWYW